MTVDNGKVISDGSRNVVIGLGMPGLKDNLDLSSDIADDVDIPEGITLMKKVTVQLTVAEKEQEGGNESDTNTEQKGQ